VGRCVRSAVGLRDGSYYDGPSVTLFPVGSFEGSLSWQSEWGLPSVHFKAEKLVCTSVAGISQSAGVCCGFSEGSKVVGLVFWVFGQEGGRIDGTSLDSLLGRPKCFNFF